MGKIAINELKDRMYQQCIRHGMPESDAEVLTDVYMRASYRGVGHHDVYDLFSRFKALTNGRINKTPELKCVVEAGAMEVWDGDYGLGELCCHHITRRSMALAKEHGIGFATIRNSNHFLAAAPYVEMADDEGYLSIVMSKSPSGISLPGADKNIIGNNPFGFAAGHGDGQVLFDICNAYSSYGKMKQMAADGDVIPEYWGNDKEGNPTTNPQDVLDSGLYMPMANHKGFGLAIMIELFSAVIGGGVILNQNEDESGMKGPYTQTAITIDVSKLMPEADYRERVAFMVERFRELYPDIYIPGERSVRVRQEIEERGYFEIEDDMLERLLAEEGDTL